MPATAAAPARRKPPEREKDQSREPISTPARFSPLALGLCACWDKRGNPTAGRAPLFKLPALQQAIVLSLFEVQRFYEVNRQEVPVLTQEMIASWLGCQREHVVSTFKALGKIPGLVRSERTKRGYRYTIDWSPLLSLEPRDSRKVKSRRDDKGKFRVHFEGANLQGANFRRANLKGADLRESNLENADLRGANMVGVNLHGAKLDSPFHDVRARGHHGQTISVVPADTPPVGVSGAGVGPDTGSTHITPPNQRVGDHDVRASGHHERPSSGEQTAKLGQKDSEPVVKPDLTKWTELRDWMIRACFGPGKPMSVLPRDSEVDEVYDALGDGTVQQLASHARRKLVTLYTYGFLVGLAQDCASSAAAFAAAGATRGLPTSSPTKEDLIADVVRVFERAAAPADPYRAHFQTRLEEIRANQPQVYQEAERKFMAEKPPEVK